MTINQKTSTASFDFHNAQGAHDLDVSVHFNAYDGNAHGCEVLYASSSGEKYARKIVDAMCAASGLTNRGPKHRGDLAFLNGTAETAVLVETAFCDNPSDCQTYRAKFDDICAAIAEGITGEEAGERPPVEPPERPVRPPVPPVSPPEAGHPDLKKGDTGPAVVELQEALGVLVADGDFGSITDTWVYAFQAACGLKADGIVGPMTWEEIDDLVLRVETGGPRLPPKLVDQIVTMAEESEIQEFLWPDRGMTPPGYIPGMALSFAYAVREFQEGDDAATVMAKAQGSPDKDALAYYEAEFKKLGMSNKTAGLETLRHLFVMMIGLGPARAARDTWRAETSALDNVQSDTAEASTPSDKLEYQGI